jgi:hypothetical protein
MKIGDMVKVNTVTGHIGVILNTWRNHKRQLQGVDVLLENGEIKAHVGTYALKVINEID